MTEQEVIDYFKHITIDTNTGLENITKTSEIINISIKALENQIPKEPLDFENESYLCPRCKRNNFYKGECLDKQNYCDYCGQAIKWE